MSKDLHFPTGGRDGTPDEELGRLLRPLYAAPDDETYWDGLHARILGRVHGESARGADAMEWWAVLAQWGRAGLAAAAVIAVVTGTLMLQHRADEARMAAEALLTEPPTHTMQLPDDGDAPRVNPTLRYGLP